MARKVLHTCGHVVTRPSDRKEWALLGAKFCLCADASAPVRRIAKNCRNRGWFFASARTCRDPSAELQRMGPIRRKDLQSCGPVATRPPDCKERALSDVIFCIRADLSAPVRSTAKNCRNRGWFFASARTCRDPSVGSQRAGPIRRKVLQSCGPVATRPLDRKELPSSGRWVRLTCVERQVPRRPPDAR